MNEVAWNLFQEYDTDGSGFLDAGELGKFMCNVAEAFKMPKPKPREVQ